MQQTPQGIKTRARRLWNNHAASVIVVGINITAFAALNHDRPGAGNDLTTAVLVPLAPGFILWALSGKAIYFGYGCSCYYLLDHFPGVPGWAEFLTVVAGLPTACIMSILRINGWTCRKTIRTTLLKTAAWLQVELPTTTPDVLKRAADRANTQAETLIIALVWATTVIVSIIMVPITLEITSGFWSAIQEQSTP